MLALVEAARAHQPFVNWRRAAIERLCIDMVADLRQMGWRVEREEPAAATLIKASSGRASREPSSSVRAHAERRAPR